MLNMDNTASSSAEDGFEWWHHVTCRNFSLSDCDKPSSPFRARIASRQFGPLAISDASSVGAESIVMKREPVHIRADQRDHFMLYLVLEGRVDLEQDHRRTSAWAGDIFIYDQTMPFQLDFHRSHLILVNIPRTLLVSRVPGVRRLTAQRLVGASKMGALAGSLVRQMSDFDVHQSAVADRLAISAVDIFATALDAELGGDDELQQERHRLLPAVKSYILAHLHEPGLDLESIARAQNMATRTLNRVFASEGTTPIRWLWQQRLAASHKVLAEGRVGSVTDAALACGFTDISHFSRAFKREFGCPPHTVIAAK